MTLIGIDIGTSFIKGAVLDLERLRLQHIQRVPFPEPLPGLPPLFREYAPQAVLEAVSCLLKDLLVEADDCEGLVLCSQMHGLVLMTGQSQPLSNLVTWQDQRGLAPHPSGKGTYFDILSQRIGPDERRQMGNELRPGLPVGLLFWLAEQGQLPGGEAIPAALPDFILSSLCQTRPVTEITNALSHGLLNLETLGWHSEVITHLGLAGLRWPAIVPHGVVVGQLALGDRSIPCYTPIGDYQAAILGALLREGELSLNISTGSQASLLRPGLEFGDFQTRPFFDGRFLACITHIPAGWSLNLLVRLLSELAEAQQVRLADPWPYISQTAAAVPGTRLQVDLAFFSSSCGDPQTDWLTPPFHRDRNALRVAAEAGFGTVDLNQIDFLSELPVPVGEFFVKATDPPDRVVSWRRTTAEQALFYRDHQVEFVRQYAGKYILLQMGQVRWAGSEWNMEESRRILSGAHPEQGMWIKYVDGEEAEGEHFKVYEKTLQQVKDMVDMSRTEFGHDRPSL